MFDIHYFNMGVHIIRYNFQKYINLWTLIVEMKLFHYQRWHGREGVLAV